eukprot:1021415-Pleurochrysis_carterae.AAC.1
MPKPVPMLMPKPVPMLMLLLLSLMMLSRFQADFRDCDLTAAARSPLTLTLRLSCGFGPRVARSFGDRAGRSGLHVSGRAQNDLGAHFDVFRARDRYFLHALVGVDM